MYTHGQRLLATFENAPPVPRLSLSLSPGYTPGAFRRAFRPSEMARVIHPNLWDPAVCTVDTWVYTVTYARDAVWVDYGWSQRTGRVGQYRGHVVGGHKEECKRNI